jgi:hypothetical protein
MEFSSRVGLMTLQIPRCWSWLHYLSVSYFYLYLVSEIVEKKCKDVREALRKFRDQMIEQI